MELALGKILKLYINLSKGLKLKVRKLLELIPTFVEVTGGKLVGGPFCPPPVLNKVNQLLSITNEIYQSFDDNLEVRPVFLEISKTFDMVWHKGLIYKLKQNDISGNNWIVLSTS